MEEKKRSNIIGDIFSTIGDIFCSIAEAIADMDIDDIDFD